MPQKCQSKACEVCREPFTPDARVGDRQRVCTKLFCQLTRKRRSQKAWVSRNPGYFKGRYPQLKEQIRKNQADRRLPMPPESELTIQDELTLYKNSLMPVVIKNLSIQDEITSYLTKGKRPLRQALKQLYKTSQQPVIV